MSSWAQTICDDVATAQSVFLPSTMLLLNEMVHGNDSGLGRRQSLKCLTGTYYAMKRSLIATQCLKQLQVGNMGLLLLVAGLV